jgi:hypothetical protein
VWGSDNWSSCPLNRHAARGRPNVDDRADRRAGADVTTMGSQWCMSVVGKVRASGLEDYAVEAVALSCCLLSEQGETGCRAEATNRRHSG